MRYYGNEQRSLDQGLSPAVRKNPLRNILARATKAKVVLFGPWF